MKNAIIVHGRPDKDEYYSYLYPSPSNFQWIPWLQKRLLVNEIKADTPEMPHAYQPRYDVWCKEFERFDITPETMLVGHSCGGGFLVRWLSEHKDVQVGKVFLVAPWTNPDDNPASDTADFFHFDIDPELVSRTKGVRVFVSDDDQDNIHETVGILKDSIKDLSIREFTGKGHFVVEHTGSMEFPELLEEMLR